MNRGSDSSMARSVKKDTKAARRAKIDFFDAVTVLVGEGEDKFMLHTRLVCKTSEFFKKMQINDWKETAEGVVRFPETETETFKIYLGWLYTGNLEFEHDGHNKEKSDLREIHTLLELLVDAYIFGDMLQNARFRNTVLKAIVALEEVHKFPGPRIVRRAWDMVPSTSKLVQLLVDCTLCFGEGYGELSNMEKLLPQGFITELARAVMAEPDKAPVQRDPASRERGYYHD